MRVLFLSRWFPWPADNGSKLRITGLIEALAQEFQVDLISFATEPVTEEQITQSKLFCSEISCVLYQGFNPRSFRSILGFFAPVPRFLVDTYHPEYESKISDALSKHSYDLVVLSEVDSTPYLKLFQGMKTVLDELQISIFQSDGETKIGLGHIRKALTRLKQRYFIKRLSESLDGFTVVSQKEKNLLLDIIPAQTKVEVVPNGINTANYLGDWDAPDVHSLIYCGSLTYYANLDAVNYFIKAIFPNVKVKEPAARLFVTGKFDTEIIKKLPLDDHVVFTGYLDDVRARIARSWISVIPLRIGGGTRFKILESLALGTPVVSTSKGAEGLDLVLGREIIIADTPDRFAKEIIDLMRDEDKRNELSENGRKAVQAKYEWTRISRSYLDFIKKVIS